MSDDTGQAFRQGARLAIDWGTVRIGVAACDPDGLLAFPVETVPAKDEVAAFGRLTSLARQYDAIEVVMGLPVALSGRQELAATAVTAVARRLASQLTVPLRVVDERLTSVLANRQLSGVATSKRRSIVDQAAAAGILEGALAFERHTGHPPGHLICDPPMEGDV